MLSLPRESASSVSAPMTLHSVDDPDYANTEANGADYANTEANGADCATSESQFIVDDEIELEPLSNDFSGYEDCYVTELKPVANEDNPGRAPNCYITDNSTEETTSLLA